MDLRSQRWSWVALVAARPRAGRLGRVVVDHPGATRAEPAAVRLADRRGDGVSEVVPGGRGAGGDAGDPATRRPAAARDPRPGRRRRRCCRSSRPDGVLTPPSDPQELGWWADGARPGDPRGSALVTGHTVSTGGGALDDLEDLDEGDRILVHSARKESGYAGRERRGARQGRPRRPGRAALQPGGARPAGRRDLRGLERRRVPQQRRRHRDAGRCPLSFRRVCGPVAQCW